MQVLAFLLDFTSSFIRVFGDCENDKEMENLQIVMENKMGTGATI